MKRGLRLVLVAALATGAFFALPLLRRGARTPAEALADVQARIARGHASEQQLLSELASVIGMARSEGAVEVATRARMERGRLLLSLGAHDAAREDLFACLDHDPTDVEVRTLLVDLEAEAGELDQAIARARALVEEDATRAAIWTRLGVLHEGRAARRIAACEETIRRALIREDEVRARKILQDGAALDPKDPRRRVLSLRLGEVFGERSLERLQDARRAMDEAGEDLATARAAYGAALEQGPAPEPAARLLGLLERAKRTDDLLDLGLAALRHPELRRSPAVLAPLIRALDARGRHAFASEIAFWITQEGLTADADLLETCVWVHERAGQWGRMLQTAVPMRVRGSTAQQILTAFLDGYGYTKLAVWEPRVLFSLRSWVGTGERESYPGMLADAWFAIYEQLEHYGQPWEVREALETCLRADPERDGALWLHLAELHAGERHGGYRLPEERWARGMALSPERVEELMPRWRELGELEVAAESFDPVLVHQSMLTNSVWRPSAELSPYQVWRLVEVESGERDDPERAFSAAKRLLEMLPGFLPAHDSAIELALRMERRPDAARLLVERIEVGGHDARTAGWLRAIPTELFDGRQRVRLMRAAPETIGRATLARALLDSGRGDRALAVLGQLQAVDGDPEVHRLAARLALELGAPESAEELVRPLSLDPLHRTDDLALVVGLDLALGGGQSAGLIEALEPAGLADEPSATDAWLETADRLLAAGEDTLAARLLARLDEEGPSGGPVLLRRALAELALRRAVPARTALARGEAFDRSGRASLVRLVLDIELDGGGLLVENAKELRATAYLLSPRQQAALELLAGEPARAREHLAEEPSALDPRGALLFAAAQAVAGEPVLLPAALGANAGVEASRLVEEPATRRRLLTLLLGLEEPLLEPWAACGLGRLARSEANPWTSLLTLEAAPDRALLAARREELARLGAEQPDFLPQERERIAGALGLRDVDALDAQDADIAGDGGPIARAVAEQRAGHTRHAIEILQELALAAEGGSAVHRRLGRLYAAQGLWAQAVDAYLAAIGTALGDEARPALEELAGLLQEARERSGITLAREREVLAELEARAPDDPAVALARARYEVASDPRNPSLSLARAYGVLTRFRQAHPGVSLESLRPGAGEAWMRFHLGLDPARARALAEDELVLAPGSLEVWILLGEALEKEARWKEAHEHFELVRRMAPRDLRVLRSLLALESQGLADRDAVNERAAEIRAIEGAEEPDAELAWWRANALYLGGPRTLAGASVRIEPVWAARDTLPAELPATRVGQRYAAALIATGTEEAFARARQIAGGLAARSTEPYRRDVARALVGLAR